MNTAVFRHGRACPGHPRLPSSKAVFKTWMLPTRAAMTIWRSVVFIGSGLRLIGLPRNDRAGDAVASARDRRIFGLDRGLVEMVVVAVDVDRDRLARASVLHPVDVRPGRQHA